MALANDPIGLETIERYLKEGGGSLAFELAVRNQLQKLGFTCHHGGTYSDPVSGTPRTFDIQAEYTMPRLIVSLAVECKKIGVNFPLVLSCIPRKQVEAFHSVLLSYETGLSEIEGIKLPVGFRQSYHCATGTIKGTHGLYLGGNSVAKEAVQVGLQVTPPRKQSRNQAKEVENDGDAKQVSLPPIEINESGIYGKWSQALSSAHSLVVQSRDRILRTREPYLWVAVIPVVVVPDGLLWVVNYDDEGIQVAQPKQEDHCSFYIDRNVDFETESGAVCYRLSHVEFVTPSGLDALMNRFKFPETLFNRSGLGSVLTNSL